MRFMTFINRTKVEEMGWDDFIETANTVEIVMLALSYLEFFVLFYLFIFVRTFHKNLNMMFMTYGGQYFFSMAARSIMLYYQHNHLDQESSVFKIANYTRTGCLFIAFYILPGLMVERCFATVFLKDYERFQRYWIPPLILFFLLPFCGFTAYLYIFEVVPIYMHIISFMLLNIFGYLGLKFNHYYNSKLHRDALVNRTIRCYSLSERFQLAENIKTCDMLKKIQVSIIFFNVVCTSVLIIDEICSEVVAARYATYIFFNFACIAYGVTVPVVVYWCSPEWIREVKRLCRRLTCNSTVAPVSELLTTHHQPMSFANTKIQADEYFKQLNHHLA